MLPLFLCIAFPSCKDREILFQMEENKKTEELQSRREFFKQAAKKALPIIGAIALANVPLLSHAAEKVDSPMDCDWGCMYGCKGGCGRQCSTGCTNSCSGSCDGACKGACQGSCKGYCSGSTKGYY